jgi:mycothiol synthase
MTPPNAARHRSRFDGTRYALREFVDADYEAEAAIETRNDPDSPRTADEVRHFDGATLQVPGRVNFRRAVVERASGATVAFGSLRHIPFQFHPQKFWLYVSVDLDHRHRGIGPMLYDFLAGEGDRRGAIALWAGYREGDDDSRRFVEARGFTVRRKIWDARLDLAAYDPGTFPDRTDALAAEGIRISTLADEGADDEEVLRRLYRLAVESSRDVPRMGEFTPYTYEDFLQFDVRLPGAIPEGFFLARHGDEFVGWSTVERAEAKLDTLRVGFTGTDRRYRGRGLATELKRRAVEYARSHGYRYVITNNDSLNAPIRAINEKMGFQPRIAYVHCEKTVGPSGP